jgi:hypothetical protein
MRTSPGGEVALLDWEDVVADSPAGSPEARAQASRLAEAYRRLS